MNEKRGLLADLERAMNGLAHAHLGDYLEDQAKRAALGVAEPVRLYCRLPGPDSGVAAPRRVALAVHGQLEPHALRYARNACERMDADLDLLTDLCEGRLKDAIESQAPDSIGDRIGDPIGDLTGTLTRAGRRLEIVRLGRDILTGILDYARARRGLLFVVVSAEDELAERVVAGSTQGRHLDVPWVVVAAADSARPSP